MRAVLPDLDPADPRPRLGELPEPRPAAGEVLLRVRAAALNRADLMQVRGRYSPPPGESTVPGLECAGEIAEFGPEVLGWTVGDRAMALLAGGGQAEWVAVPAGQLMAVPAHLSLLEAAALPEAALTAWTNLVAEGGLRAGETVLLTAAASGVGTFAVQLARELGAHVLVAGRSLERLEPLRELGAEGACLLGESLPAAVRELNRGRGADLAMDLVGGEGMRHVLAALAPRGRLVLVGLLGGPRGELDLDVVLRRRLRLVGSLLRPRTRAEKAELVRAFVDFAAARLADGRLRPVVDRVFPLAEVADAYEALAAGGITGKIVLEI